ncbi:hypothetical protein [Kinneretia aquatilis]|uniref:hypothetical protein n=1 Tax=Kinneretia aquatilis TaxID=2070761 RepID=UPI00149520CE|nr:hypothetical protein [Paucibacter aquatile]WIV99314.1 hypothetical protein K9V56_007490 [Paucibacter aquatile]
MELKKGSLMASLFVLRREFSIAEMARYARPMFNDLRNGGRRWPLSLNRVRVKSKISREGLQEAKYSV